MADKPLRAANAVREETFERWWPKARAEFLLEENDLEARRLAQAAWRRAWGSRNEPPKKFWSVTSAVLIQAQADVQVAESHVVIATEIAKRYGLTIQNVGSLEKGRVEATRDGKLIVVRRGWLELVAQLKLMESEGRL